MKRTTPQKYADRADMNLNSVANDLAQLADMVQDNKLRDMASEVRRMRSLVRGYMHRVDREETA